MLLLLLVSPGYDCPQCEDVAFNSALWKGASTDSFVRQQMVGDLLSRHRLLGLKQQAIEDLLGAPTPMGYSRAGCDYLTWLGPERSIFALDSNYLCLRFADGVVTNARIVED
jgi:hypothetical protein